MKFSGLADVQALAAQRDDLTVYNAGLPRFPRNFTRDGIIAALISSEMQVLRDQVAFCALHMGTKTDAESGEEPGKVHHEWPGYPLREKLTTYNACDATAFFLIGLLQYWRATDDDQFVESLREQIINGVHYIFRHINEVGLFEDDPAFCGANHFALKVTYWKDSVIMGREAGEPTFPVTYSLAHAQNLCALRAAASLLNTGLYDAEILSMSNAVSRLWDHANDTFYAAIDADGPISANTSDALQMLYYLTPNDITQTQIAHIERSAEALETHIGYLAASLDTAAGMQRGYHAATVWPFEQALIHAGADKFGLDRVKRICERVMRTVSLGSPEVVGVNFEEYEISCNPQLWTLAAHVYFNSL